MNLLQKLFFNIYFTIKKKIKKNQKQFFWPKTYFFTKQFLNNNKNLKIGLEVGVAAGSHINTILKKTPVKKMYGVDPYRFYGTENEKPLINDLMLFFSIYANTTNSKKILFDKFYELAKKNLSFHGNRAKLIRKTSKQAVKYFKDQSLDFVFIDADHSFKNCYQDIQLWYPKICINGYIMGHDYNFKYFPGVVKAVNKAFNVNDIQTDKKSEIWYVKKLNIKL